MTGRLTDPLTETRKSHPEKYSNSKVVSLINLYPKLSRWRCYSDVYLLLSSREPDPGWLHSLPSNTVNTLRSTNDLSIELPININNIYDGVTPRPDIDFTALNTLLRKSRLEL